jgi:hypothetical protein
MEQIAQFSADQNNTKKPNICFRLCLSCRTSREHPDEAQETGICSILIAYQSELTYSMKSRVDYEPSLVSEKEIES